MAEPSSSDLVSSKKCKGKEAGVSFAVFVFLLVWVVVLAALGVVISIQNDPPEPLKNAVFGFSIATFPILLFGFILWFTLACCTAEQVCRNKELLLLETQVEPARVTLP